MYERVHLYYDFMFCLLNDRSFAQLKTIHVFVDFSGGEDYNRFIAKIIASFNYMDVMIDHKLTLETDLYLSDFYSSKVRCRQLTWRHLPETKDWQVFAEVVRELRKGETQKMSTMRETQSRCGENKNTKDSQLRHAGNYKDLTGQKFGELTVVAPTVKEKKG